MSQPTDPSHDPFAPPKTPCEVQCLHCGESYDSWLIAWRDDKQLGGFWCCPTPDCDGVGFGFDIFPVDPEWRDEHGEHLIAQFEDDDEDEDDFDDEDSEAFEDDDDEDAPHFAAVTGGPDVDVFDADAFWIDARPFLPRPVGDTPQAPFDKTYGKTVWTDDDIPF